MGERVLCKHEVVGSIPIASTMRLRGRCPTGGASAEKDPGETHRDTGRYDGWSGPFEDLDPGQVKRVCDRGKA